MNTDYRTPTSFYNDTRTARLQRRLGDSGIAAITFLWCFTALYRAEGILTDMDEEDIEFAAKWHGEKGKLVPTLLELQYLEKLQDGTYAVHKWTETNSWAADADNRSDKARLSGMARNYPELYEELIAQGYTGIDRSSYARLTSEYNARGILRSSSSSLRIASESLAPMPSPTPAPVPVPEPRKTNDVNTSNLPASSALLEDQTNTHEEPSNQTEASQPERQLLIPLEAPEEPSGQAKPVRPEDTATLGKVLAVWNTQLGTLGFHKVQGVTPRRKGAFKARLNCSRERLSLAWWIALFGKIAASEFMRESAAQKANWLTIDWVLNEDNLTKILEGKYDSDRPRKATVSGFVRGSIMKTYKYDCSELYPKETPLITAEENAQVDAEIQADAQKEEEMLRHARESIRRDRA